MHHTYCLHTIHFSFFKWSLHSYAAIVLNFSSGTSVETLLIVIGIGPKMPSAHTDTNHVFPEVWWPLCYCAVYTFKCGLGSGQSERVSPYHISMQSLVQFSIRIMPFWSHCPARCMQTMCKCSTKTQFRQTMPFHEHYAVERENVHGVCISHSI